MNVKRTMLTATAMLLLGFAIQAGSAAAATYDLAGSYVPAPVSSTCDITFDTGCFSSYSYEGAATCRAACTGAPRTGTFSLQLAGGARAYPQSACISQQVAGTLTFSSTDVSIPGGPPIRVATVFGNSVDSRGYMVRSVPGGTPIRGGLSAFVSIPNDPVRPTDTAACVAGSFSGDLELPPNPIIPAA